MTKNLQILLVAALVVLLTATGGFAAATICDPTVTYGNGTPTSFKPAVAENYVETAYAMLEKFADDTSSSIAVTLCHNSTSALEADITNGVIYDMLFAADGSAGSYGANAFTYARGIPVFFARNSSILTVGGLIDGLGAVASNTSASISASNLSSYDINATLQGITDAVAVAGSGAPYGVKGQAIVNSLEQEDSATVNLPTIIPTWIDSPLFDNIALTFSAVDPDSGTPTSLAGFVSKGQICHGIAPSYTSTPPLYTYVAFTNSTYTLNQTASIPNANTVATALRNYIVTGGTTWASFLAAHCYNAP
jgi:hypothetical protein